MKKWEKRIGVYVIISLGLILVLISRYYYIDNEIEIDTDEHKIYAPKDGAIVYGTNLTRYYEIGERLSLRLTPKIGVPAFPDELPLEFTVMEPGGNASLFVYFLRPQSNPLNPSDLLILVISDLVIIRTEKLISVNSSGLDFVGKVTESGNYTLVFTSNYTKDFSPLNYLALLKIKVEREYPYNFLTFAGVGLTVVGTALTIWYNISKKKRTHRI